MIPNLTKWGPITVFLLAIALLVVLVGGIVVITHPETLTFNQYLDQLTKALIALAGLAVGRGIHLGATSLADAHVTGKIHEVTGEIAGLSEGIKPVEEPENG